MPKNLLRGALVDAMAHAERLPRLAKRVEVHDTAEAVFLHDSGLLEIGFENVVRRPVEPKDLLGRLNVLGACLAQCGSNLGTKRHGALGLVLHRTLAKEGEGLGFVQVKIRPHKRTHFRLPLPGVEKHLIGELPLAGDSEQPAQLVLSKSTSLAHLLALRLDSIEPG